MVATTRKFKVFRNQMSCRNENDSLFGQLFFFWFSICFEWACQDF